MMKIVITTISATLILVLSAHVILGQATKVTPAEYVVYAAVLRGIYKENLRDYSNKSHFVFLDKTLKSDDPAASPRKKYRQLIRTFDKLNRLRGMIERNFPRGEYSKNYNLISSDEIDALFREGNAEYEKQREKERLLGKPIVIDFCGSVSWKPFYRQFPEASGYYELSRVAFHDTRAMVRIQRTDVCGGFDMTYVLSNMKKGWSVEWSAGSEWVS